MNSARFARMAEQETLDGSLAYSPVDFLTTVRKGIWKELDSQQVKIDPYRRELQRSYLQAVNNKLNPPPAAAVPVVQPAGEETGRTPARPPASGDEKPLYRVELRALSASLTTAIAKTTDQETKAHLEASKDEIAKILDPLPAVRTTASGKPAGVAGRNRGTSAVRKDTTAVENRYAVGRLHAIEPTGVDNVSCCDCSCETRILEGNAAALLRNALHCPTEQANLNLLTPSKDSNLSPVSTAPSPVRRKRQARWFKADAEFTKTTICSAEQQSLLLLIEA